MGRLEGKTIQRTQENSSGELILFFGDDTYLFIGPTELYYVDENDPCNSAILMNLTPKPEHDTLVRKVIT